MGMSRHRLATDGRGVTTLVGFHGCPLNCKYCLNNQCHNPDCIAKVLTPAELVAELLVDNLYFLATGGGVCFGGGEPLLYGDFIKSFCEVKVPEWKVTLETSLNVPAHSLEVVIPHIDQYVIDIKDLNPVIYHEYTGGDNAPVLANLQRLLCHHRLAERIVVRLPHIPGYNSRQDIDLSKRKLAKMGIIHFDEFDYIVQ